MSELSLPTSVQAANPPRPILSGWIPYYSVKTVLPFVKKIPTIVAPVVGAPITCEDSEFTPSDLAFINASYLYTNRDLMKEVNPFWYTLKSPTVIRDDYITANPSWPMSGVVCLMKKAGLSIVPTLTDGTAKLVLSKYLADTTSRTSIVNAIYDLVLKNNFDGIDLNFEGFAFVDENTTWVETAPNWIAFIKELAAKLHGASKTLSVTSPVHFNPTERIKGYTVYSWSAIAPFIDRLRIMAYDYSVSNAGPIGPIGWTEKSVQYAISVMPASKVFIGLPGYGRDWINKVTGTCPTSAPPGLSASSKAATFKMNYASAKASIDGAVPIFDEKNSEATYSYMRTFNGQTLKGAATSCIVSRTVWYQNARSYAERLALVAAYRLAGISLWTLGMEDVSATNEIRKAALAIAPDEVVSALTSDRNELQFGEIFTITGNISLKDRSPISGLSVILEARKANQTDWIKIADATTGIDGLISIPILIGTSTTLRLKTEGTWERSASLSSETNISLKSRLNIIPPTQVKRGAAITISGGILPAESGRSVNLQKFLSGKWQNSGVVVPTDAAGNFSVTTTELKRGIVKMKIVISATATAPEISSSTFAIIIR